MMTSSGVKALLQRKSNNAVGRVKDVEYAKDKKWTLMCKAFRNRQLDTNDLGCNSLHYIIESLPDETSALSYIESAIAAGVDPNTPDCTGRTPLWYAAYLGKSAIFEYLFLALNKRNSRFYYADELGNNFLHATVIGSRFITDTAEVALLIFDNPDDPETPSPLSNMDTPYLRIRYFIYTSNKEFFDRMAEEKNKAGNAPSNPSFMQDHCLVEENLGYLLIQSSRLTFYAFQKRHLSPALQGGPGSISIPPEVKEKSDKMTEALKGLGVPFHHGVSIPKKVTKQTPISTGSTLQKLEKNKKRFNQVVERKLLLPPETKHYKRLLSLGEADFSFSLAFLKKRESEGDGEIAKSMVSTELRSKVSLSKEYPRFASNYAYLKNKGVTIKFGVDATRLHDYKGIKARAPYERIHFNFPNDGKPYQVQSLPKIMGGFFKSAAELQDVSNRIYIAVPNRQMGEIEYQYGLCEAATSAKYVYVDKNKFNKDRYSDYAHCTNNKTHNPPDVSDAKELVFEKTDLPDDEIRKLYPTEISYYHTQYGEDYRIKVFKHNISTHTDSTDLLVADDKALTRKPRRKLKTFVTEASASSLETTPSTSLTRRGIADAKKLQWKAKPVLSTVSPENNTDAAQIKDSQLNKIASVKKKKKKKKKKSQVDDLSLDAPIVQDAPRNLPPEENPLEQKTLTGSHLGITFTFNEMKITEDGDCGFNALETTREGLVQILKSRSSSPDSRSKLAPEIREFLLSLTKEALQDLEEDLGEMGRGKDFILLTQARESLLYEKELLVSKELFEAYLNVYRIEKPESKLYLGYWAALLYAKYRLGDPINLYIWRVPSIGGRMLTCLHHYPEDSDLESKRTKHLMHTNNLTHYNVLEEIERNASLGVQPARLFAPQKRVVDKKAQTFLRGTPASKGGFTSKEGQFVGKHSSHPHYSTQAKVWTFPRGLPACKGGLITRGGRVVGKHSSLRRYSLFAKTTNKNSQSDTAAPILKKGRRLKRGQ